MGARHHLEWGHKKYVMDTIQGHPAQVYFLLFMFPLITNCCLKFISAKVLGTHVCSNMVCYIIYLMTMKKGICFRPLAFRSSFDVSQTYPSLISSLCNQRTSLYFNPYSSHLCADNVGCSWWDYWKFANNPCLPSGLSDLLHLPKIWTLQK